MKINSIQRIIILVGLATIIVMSVFPPWTYTFSYQTTFIEEPAGYQFIASPPPRKEAHGPFGGIKLDVPRLLIQWTVVIGASSFGLFAASWRKNPNK